MAFDSIDSNHELLCNLLVGCTPCECLEDLQLSLSQRIKQGLSLGVLSRLLRLMFLHLTLLGKGSEHCVQVGSWPSFALLFPEPGEESLHRCSLVHKAADVALRLGQTDCLRAGREGLRLFLAHLMGQGLQELYLNHVTP